MMLFQQERQLLTPLGAEGRIRRNQVPTQDIQTKLNVCVLRHPQVEILSPNMMVFGDGDFGRPLGFDGVTRMKAPRRN